MIETYPAQAYTVLAEELIQFSGIDIGGEYTHRPLNQSTTGIAAMVFQQYSPHYKNLKPIG